MLNALTDLYRQAWRYALACPLLFLLPVAAEAAQHVVEYLQGFYGGIGHARTVEHTPLRTAFGTAKIASLLIGSYWVVRWLEWRDPARSFGFDTGSLATFLPLLLFELALGLPGIWLPVLSPRFAMLPIWTLPLSFVLGLLFADWHRTAPLGQAGGPIHSARVTAPVLLWAAGFEIVAVLPLMVLHYVLGFQAMKAAGVAQGGLLVVDTLFVGYLGAVVAGVSWYISERARTRRLSAQ